MEKFDIEQLYNKLLPRLETLEKERIALVDKLTKQKKMGIVIGIVAAIGVTFFAGVFFGVLVGGALGLTYYTISYHKSIKEYRNNYKSKIFQVLIEELGSNYKYTPDGSLEEELMRNSGIFHQFTKAKCEDLIEGNFANYSFKMAETNLWYSKQNSKNTDRGGSVSYVFKGLFFIGEIPFSLPTSIWILSKHHPMVHPVHRVKDGWQKVGVDHKAFRQEYDIYASNREAAKKYLQGNVLDTILETKSQIVESGMHLELSIQPHKIYISISTTKELFEPPVKSPITDKELFKDNFKFLVAVTGLLQLLTPAD